MAIRAGSDFYTSFHLREQDLRATYDNMKGYLNHRYPNAKNDYEAAMTVLRKDCGKPVFSFEVGQFEVLPDFGEIADFRGVTRAVNYELIRKKVEQSGAMDTWTKQVEATGELSNLCYREEVEAALRTERYSGISLLGIQDFPGQGTALVGMLNAHLQPKPYPFAQPERFRAFFRDVLPLALLEKYTYENTETLVAQVKLANYGKADLTGRAQWRLEGAEGSQQGELPQATAPCGTLTMLGELRIPLADVHKPARLTLTVEMHGARNVYPLWVYPPVQPVCPENVHECRTLDDAALAVLASGGTVLPGPGQHQGGAAQLHPGAVFHGLLVGGDLCRAGGWHGTADGCGAPAVCRLSHGDAQQLAVVAHGQSARDDSPAADAGHRSGNGQLCLSAAHGQAAGMPLPGGTADDFLHGAAQFAAVS